MLIFKSNSMSDAYRPQTKKTAFSIFIKSVINNPLCQYSHWRLKYES